MACDDLIATSEDVAMRIKRPIDDPDELATVEALLADASSIVRMITGEPFGEMTVTTKLRVRDGRVSLPADDITSVTSVTPVGSETAVAATWDGLRWLYVGTTATEAFDLEPLCPPADVVQVTFVRTGEAAPQWVVAIVAQMAARAFGRPADQSGVQQESIQGYSYSVGVAAAAGGVGLLQYEEKMLREGFPPALGQAWLGLSR